MNKTNPSTPETFLSSPETKPEKAPFPKAILSVSREEFDNIELTVKAGLTETNAELPSDLQGYVFILGPAGSIDSPKESDSSEVVKPAENGWNPLYNGDGMVRRIGFTGGKAQLKTKIPKTASYYADTIAYQNPAYAHLNFQNIGIARASLKLGIATQLSVTLTPFKFSEVEPYRLSITVDMGRPYEIDPEKLEVLQSIGLNQEWKSVNVLLPSQPFPLCMSAAHPCFDFDSGELYTINLGRSISSFLPNIRKLFYHFPILGQPFNKPPLLGRESNFWERLWQICQNILQSLLKFLIKIGKEIYQCIEQAINFFRKVFLGLTDDFVEIIRWHGSGEFERWKVVLSDDSPVKIKETLHQLGLTKNYIVLMDTAFKLALEEMLFPSRYEIIVDLEIFLRKLTDKPQLADTRIYIIPRSELKPGNPTVKARKVVIPSEIAHYVVDYDDTDGIVIHTVNSCATDAAETIRCFDKSVYDDGEINNRLQNLAGMLIDGMDTCSIACYVIDPNKLPAPNSVKSYLIDRHYTWGNPVYAYRNMTLKQPDKIEDIYWIFYGAWEELNPQFAFDLYKHYKYRKVPAKQAKAINREGRPTTLCRVRIDRKKNQKQELEIELTTPDYYQFPPGYFANSPQFVPRQGGTGTSSDGYIFCVILFDGKDGSPNTEIWIFDAAKLSDGPKYRLSNPKMCFGFTIHTTWLPDAVSPPASGYSVRDDYEQIVSEVVKKYLDSKKPEKQKIGAEIEALFEEIYKQFE